MTATEACARFRYSGNGACLRFRISREIDAMKKNTTRREFFRNASLAAGLAAASAAANRAAEPAQPTVNHQDYPRYQPGPGGPVGSATDRGKLVPGLRDPSGPPVPIVVPDSWKLRPKWRARSKCFIFTPRRPGASFCRARG